MADISAIKLPSNTVYTIKDAHLKGVYTVKGTQVSSTGTWTGAIDAPALFDGMTIAYYLPYVGSGNATLNLTLSDNTTTGAVDVYYNNTTRMTLQYEAGSIIILTYWSAGSISISGTATSTNRWICCQSSGSISDGFTIIQDEEDSHGGIIRHITTGQTVQGNLDISENGTYNVGNYASATVSVASGASVSTVRLTPGNNNTVSVSEGFDNLKEAILSSVVVFLYALATNDDLILSVNRIDSVNEMIYLSSHYDGTMVEIELEAATSSTMTGTVTTYGIVGSSAEGSYVLLFPEAEGSYF